MYYICIEKYCLQRFLSLTSTLPTHTHAHTPPPPYTHFHTPCHRTPQAPRHLEQKAGVAHISPSPWAAPMYAYMRGMACMNPPPHITCMYPPPHMTCMNPPPHITCMYPPPHMTCFTRGMRM